MENNNNGVYEYLEMLEPRRSSSLPLKCRSSVLSEYRKHEKENQNVSKSSTVPKMSTRKDPGNITKQDKIVHKIRNVFSILKSKENQIPPRSSVIESDFERDQNENHENSHSENSETPVPGSNSYGTFEDTLEYKSCCALTRQLKTCLGSAKDRQLLCDLILPVNLLSRVAQDIMRMSYYEPCGVRGSVVFINIDDGAKSTNIGKLVCDPSIVPTFELYLTLKEDTRSWVTIRKWLYFVQTCFSDEKSGKKSPPKVLGEGFQLAKKKLYRPN